MSWFSAKKKTTREEREEAFKRHEETTRSTKEQWRKERYNLELVVNEIMNKKAVK